MTPETIDLVIKFANLGMALGAIVYTFVATRRKDVDTRIDRVEARVVTAEGEVAALKRSVEDSPGREDLHGIALAISDMRGELRVISVEMKGQNDLMGRLENIVGRHEDHLISKGAR